VDDDTKTLLNGSHKRLLFTEFGFSCDQQNLRLLNRHETFTTELSKHRVSVLCFNQRHSSAKMVEIV